MGRVVHFEISANEPEKVIKFYRDVFGWEVTEFPGPQAYWLINTGDTNEPGINGGFFKPNEEFNGTVNTVQVDDIDACAEAIKSYGGQVVVEKMTIPGVGYQIYCKDVEGTIFGIHQPDPNASL